MKSAPHVHVAEPPVQYRARAPVVTDCSVIVGALFQEDWRDDAQQQIAVRELHAPYLLQVEFASVALKKARQGFVELAGDALDQFQGLAVELHRIETPAVVALARTYQLSAYDASYLWLAADLRLPLVTFDDRLAAAARHCLGGLS